MHQFIFTLALLATLLFGINHADAKGIYQSEEDFINEVFSDTPPAVARLWLKKEQRKTASEIMQRKMPLRIKYWRKDNRSAWILEEIGKEKPITTGIVIQQGRIEKLKVLIFRESRGWEVRHSFFTDQFVNIDADTKSHKLDRNIDGISGATLSVRALKKLAQLALFLDDILSSNQHDT